MDDELQAGHFKVAIAIATALLTAFLGGGIVLWRDFAVLSHDVEELRATYITDAATLAAIAQQAHANTIHRAEHERTAEREIARIGANEQRSYRNQIAITELKTDSDTRADPNTGTEGRIRDKRLDRVEVRVDRVEDKLRGKE